MTVARDAVLEFATFTTTSPATLSFTPTGTPRGVTVHIVINGAGTDTVTAVTYGGVAMQRVSTSADITSETARVWTYFLGASIPTGTQTVSITHTGTAQTKWAIVQTVTAAGDTQVGTVGLVNNGDIANPGVLLDSGSLSALRVGIVFSGHDDPGSLTPLSGMEANAAGTTHDFTSQSALLAQETTASTGAFTLGYTATSEDIAMVGVAIEEIPTDGFPAMAAPTPSYFLANGTSHLVIMPAVVDSGDLLVMIVPTISTTVTTPTGWTLLDNPVSSYETNIYYKIADGTEGDTTVDVVTSASCKGSAQVLRITDWHGTTPPEVGTAATGTSTAPNPPTLTPSWGAADTLWVAIATSIYDGSGFFPTVFPTSYDNGAFIMASGTQNTFTATAQRKLNIATEDPDVYTVSASTVWHGQTLAVRPASAAQNLTGVLFQKTPTFPTGAVTLSIQPLTGSLFTKAPTFPTGAISQTGGPQPLTGSLFVKAPSFFVGTLSNPGVAGVVVPDGGLRFEAFTMPHVGVLTRKFDITKLVESYVVNDRFNDLSDGTLTMPDDFDKKISLFFVDEANHANDAGSMIRVLRGATPIAHYLVTRSEDSWSDGEPTHKLALEGLEWILDRVLVPNYDHPADPTIEPDWIYGAPSILANTGLEDGGASNLLIHVWIEDAVTAGTWTMTFGAQTTSALAWNIDITALQTAIEALSNITDISIAGAGTEANPWVIEVIDPAGTDFNVSLGDSLTGGAPLLRSMAAGGWGVTDPWTRSFNPVTGLFHGTYTNFQTSTAQAHSGVTSLYVKGALGDWPDSFPGAQQIVSVTGGRTYRAKVWIRPAAARRYRFVIRTIDETFIGGVEADLTVDTWQEMTFSVTIPEHVRQIIFRVACISNTNGHEFYLDDALLAPGFDAATLGKMLDDVRTAGIAVGSPLSWLTPTWSTTLDSDGNAWDSTRMWNVNHGQTFYQLIEYARKWNYEFRIRWDAVDARFEWDMWNPTGGGQTRAVAITGKSGVLGSAPIVRRPPGATYLKTEGNLGHWGEFASTTLDDVWGRLEKFHQDRQGVDSAELDELAERIVTKTGENTASRSITVSDPSLLPWTSYEPGDIVTLNLAPKDVKRELRVVAIVASLGTSDATPKYDIHFGSPVYSDEAAMAQGLRTLLREFRQPIPTTSDGEPVTPNFALGGSAPTFVIAASNSSDSTKARADFICLGADDNLVFQDAFNQITAGGDGRLLATEGDFYFSGTVHITESVRLEGLGVDATRLHLSDGVNLSMFHIPDVSNGGNLPDIEICFLEMDGNRANQTAGPSNGFLLDAQAQGSLHLDRVNLHDFLTHGVHSNRSATVIRVTNSDIHSNTLDGLNLFWEGAFFVSNCQILSNDRAGIWSDAGDFIIVNNVIEGNGTFGVGAGGVFQRTGQIVAGNRILNNGEDGIVLDGQASLVTGNYVAANGQHGIDCGGIDQANTVIGNVFYDNILSGIRLYGGAGGTCSGNVVAFNDQHGILVESGWVVTGNQIYSNGRQTNNTYDGISVAAAGDDADILTNQIRQDGSANIQRYGINILAGATNVWVAGNDARGTYGTGSYNDAGTGTINVWAGTFGDNY